MLSISKPLNAGQAEKYYQRDNYYLESQGEWYGSLAEDLELNNKQTTEADFSAYLRGFTPEGYKKFKLGFDPEGGRLIESAGQKYKDGTLKHRSGIDLTFNCPKSVSILSYSDDRIQAAFNAALKQTLNYIEDNYSQTRHKKNGIITFEKTNNCLFSSFQHMTSRELDPHLHAHVIMYNMTRSKNGQIMATHNDPLYKNQKHLGQHFRNQLALEIQNIGYQVDITDRNQGFFEIRGVDKPLIEVFSKRSEQVKLEVKRLRGLKYCDCPEDQLTRWAYERNVEKKDDSDFLKIVENEFNKLKASTDHVYSSYEDSELATLATINSRIPKKNVTKEFILERINEICQERKTHLGEITKKCQSHEVVKSIEILPEIKIKQALEAITENKSVFRKEDILQQALKLSIGEYNEKQLVLAFDRLVESKGVINLGKKVSISGVEEVYTSREMQQVERNIVDICRNSKTSINVSKEISDGFIDKTDLTLKLNTIFQLRENDLDKAQEKFQNVINTISNQQIKDRLTELRVLALENSNDPSKPSIDILEEIKLNPELREILEVNGRGFTIGQKDFLSQIVSTKCQFSVCQGDAGTGKSFSALYGKNLLEQNGFQVQGLAPTGKASDELARSALLANSTTIHDFILRWENSSEEKRNSMYQRGKLCFILDEAGMVGSKNALKIIQIAKEIDAKVVFVGDRKQFASIEAGKIFAELQDKAGVDMTIMKDVMRQETQQTKDIVSAISSKDYNAAFAYLQGYTEQSLPKQYTTNNFKKGQMLVFDEESSQVPQGTNAIVKEVKENIIVIEYTSTIDGETKTIEYDPKEDGEQFRVFQKDDSNGYTNTINEIDDDEKRIDAVSRDYLDYYDKMLADPKLDAIVITPTNDERTKINSKIREDLVSRNLVENKGEYTLRESNNLSGETSRFADSYKVGQVFVANSNISNMKRGNEGKIVEVNNIRNQLKVEYMDKDSGEKQSLSFDVAQHAGQFSTYNEVKTNLGINDKIAFLKNDKFEIDGKKIKIRNGQLATIVAIDEKGNVTVRLGKKDSDPKVMFNVNGNGRNQYRNITHAFCITDMKSQGGTWNKIIISANSKKNISANSFYVWITRCKEAVSIYVNNTHLLKKKASVEQSKESTLDNDPEFRKIVGIKQSDNLFEDSSYHPQLPLKKDDLFEHVHYESENSIKNNLDKTHSNDMEF